MGKLVPEWVPDYQTILSFTAAGDDGDGGSDIRNYETCVDH